MSIYSRVMSKFEKQRMITDLRFNGGMYLRDRNVVKQLVDHECENGYIKAVYDPRDDLYMLTFITAEDPKAHQEKDPVASHV